MSQGVIAVAAGWVLRELLAADSAYPVACDYTSTTLAASRWLHGGGYYLQYQLVGPYALTANAPGPETVNVLYPPVALWLLAPMALLPAVLWWAIPAVISTAALVRLRPVWWAWPVMAALLLNPRAVEAWLYGNPVIWALAFALAGAAWRWPAALVLFKPTLAPFALLGVRDRRWWLLLCAGIVAALPFSGMWLEYVRAASNVQATPGYIVHDWPMLAVAVGWRGPGAVTYRRPDQGASRGPRALPAGCGPRSHPYDEGEADWASVSRSGGAAEQAVGRLPSIC